MIKRIFDITLALIGALFLFPVFLLTTILIFIEDGRPIFYRQKRLGLNGRTFWILKFRSMVNKSRSLSIQTLNSDPEITKVGRSIRRIKIDELPQLINVILGDMSLVGPRPCLPSLQASFNVNGKKRLEVKPGITGLAQINGNIHLTWEDRWKFDALYVKNQSLLLDLKIIIKTFLVIIFGEEKFKKIRLKFEK